MRVENTTTNTCLDTFVNLYHVWRYESTSQVNDFKATNVGDPVQFPRQSAMGGMHASLDNHAACNFVTKMPYRACGVATE